MRRLAVAAAIAIAAHEVLAALIPDAAPQPPREIVAHAEVMRIAVHRVVPTPRQRLAVVPLPPPHHRIVHLRMARAGAHRGAPARPLQRAAVVARSGRPVWEAASARGVAANGVANASGTVGDGTQTHGNDALGGDEPCGFVEFSDPHGSRYDRSTGGFYVDIRMSVHFAGGSQQSMILDYPWYYASENANPWSAHNVKDPNFPTRFQPPPEAKLPAEPPLVQYVAQHSTADGMTLLRDCQGASEQPP